MITPCNFSIYDTMTWVLDTKSPLHIYNSLQGLQVIKRFEEGKKFLSIGDESQVPVLALETIKLIFESESIILNECHFYPSFLVNIISVGLLANYGYEISIKKDIFYVTLNGSIVMNGQMNNGIYIVS